MISKLQRGFSEVKTPIPLQQLIADYYRRNPEPSKRNVGTRLNILVDHRPPTRVGGLTGPSPDLDPEPGSTDRDVIAANISPPQDNSGHKTVYNPSGIIAGNFLLGRYESLDSETDSEVRLFSLDESDNHWKPVSNGPVFPQLQDPFYLGLISKWHLFGGVEIAVQERGNERIITNWRTVFYHFHEDIRELIGSDGKHPVEPFAVGPWGMKDIRMCQLENGRIALFTRPQGREAGLGKIAYTEFDDFDNLTLAIAEAQIIPELFIDNVEWGGANQVIALENDLIGVLGHIARANADNTKHYAAMTFVFDPATRTVYDLKVIALAENFCSYKCKNDCLKDVVFSSALVRLDGGQAVLYAGLGDADAGSIKIDDPFARFGHISRVID